MDQFVQVLVLLFFTTVLPFCPVVPETTSQDLLVPSSSVSAPQGEEPHCPVSLLQVLPSLTPVAHSISPKAFLGISIIISHISFLPPSYSPLRNRMLEAGRWCASLDNSVNSHSPLGSPEWAEQISLAH